MSRREILVWLAAGAAVWAFATAALAFVGGPLFRAAYWPAVAAICTGFVGLFVTLARGRGVAPSDRLSAAACLALPGMVGEVPVLLTFPDMVPSFAAGSAGDYAAFLFSGYAALLATALWWQGERTAQARQAPKIAGAAVFGSGTGVTRAALAG